METTVLIHGRALDIPLVEMTVNGKSVAHHTAAELLAASGRLERAASRLRRDGLPADDVAGHATLLRIVAEYRLVAEALNVCPLAAMA